MLVVPAVFGLAILEIWAAVPTGIALGVPPLAVWLLTVTGSLVGVAVVALGGASLRAWLGRRRGNLTVSRSGRLYRVWLRYGVPGWGLLSPLVSSSLAKHTKGLSQGAAIYSRGCECRAPVPPSNSPHARHTNATDRMLMSTCHPS